MIIGNPTRSQLDRLVSELGEEVVVIDEHQARREGLLDNPFTGLEMAARRMEVELGDRHPDDLYGGLPYARLYDTRSPAQKAADQARADAALAKQQRKAERLNVLARRGGIGLYQGVTVRPCPEVRP